MAALRSISRSKGLTLAEILMAAGLLSMVLILLVGVFIGGLQLMQSSEVHTAASSIGREVMETIEDEGGFASLPLDSTAFNGANPDPTVDGFPPEPYPVASRDDREFVVRVETQTLSSRMAAVLVTVSWDGGRIQLEKVFHAANSVL